MTKKIEVAFLWGAVATLAMWVVMILGVVTGLSPMPKPIPLAIAGRLLGGGAPLPALMVLAITSHLAYGGVWAALLVAATKRATMRTSIALGIGLWLLMQVIVLPYLGWGFFGAAIRPKIAVATLVLHLIYGSSLGWLAGRGLWVSSPSQAASHA